MKERVPFGSIACLLCVLVFSLHSVACGSDKDHAEIESIGVATQPATATAGASQQVAFRIVDDSNRPFKAAGVRIDVTLNESTFSDGERVKTARTDAEGIAHFDVSINKAKEDYVLIASSSDSFLEGVNTHTLPFNVVAGPPAAAHSSISGTDGVSNSSEGAQITIDLFDAYGNPVSGVTPTFEATGQDNVYKSCTKSDDDGMSSCTMTSETGGVKVLQLTSPVAVDGEAITFSWDCDETHAPFGAGNGTASDPYRLCAPDHLAAIGPTPLHMSRHFVVTSDINMMPIDDFTPIGSVSNNTFKGRFDGGNHRIQRLRASGTFKVGLFAVIDAAGHVENVVLRDVSIRGEGNVGGLAGINKGTIIKSSASGYVKGTGSASAFGANAIGGLVGANHGAVIASNATCTVDGGFATRVGGLVGGNYKGSSVEDAYATGAVSGENTVGGLVGYRFEDVIDTSYATGAVTAAEEDNEVRAGGLAAEIRGGDASSVVTTNSFWDNETSGQATSAGGNALTTAEFGTEATFTDANWNFTDTWTMGEDSDGNVRPVLQWQTP